MRDKNLRSVLPGSIAGQRAVGGARRLKSFIRSQTRQRSTDL
jgi:hypothetical protein